MSATRASALPNVGGFLSGSEFSVPGGKLLLGLRPIAILDVGVMQRAGYEQLLALVDEHVIVPRRPYVMITDTRRVTEIPTADVRRLLADWMKKNAAGHTSLGSATIIRSTIVRGALTAMYWLFEPPSPQYTASDWEDAHRWAVSKFDEAKVPLPGSVRTATRQPY